MIHEYHREELRHEDGAPQTPWIWNPPGLISTEADNGVITADFRDEQGHRITQEVRGSTPSRQSSFNESSIPYSHTDRHDSTPSRQGSHHRHDGLSSIYAPNTHNDPTPPRRSYDRPSDKSPDYTHDIHRDSAPSRQNSHDRPKETSSVQSLSTQSSLPPLDRPLSRPRDPSSVYYQRYHSPGASDSPPRQSPSRAVYTPEKSTPRRDKPEDASFTAKIDLQPTFSTNIVRIPNHYQSPSRRSSRDEDKVHNLSPTHTHNSSNNMLFSQLTQSMDRLNVGDNSSRPIVRHSSLPIYAPSSFTAGTSELVDEPASILSPLVYSATPKSIAYPIARGYSVPEIHGTHLNTIPEVSPVIGKNLPPSDRTSPASSNEGPPSTSSSSSTSSDPLPRPRTEIYSSVTPALRPGVQSPP